jgi:hypothetical protein
MNQVSRLAWLLGTCSLTLLSACGGDDDGPTSVSNITDPVTLCNEVVKTECKRIYECTTLQARQLVGLDLPETEPECVSQLAAYLKCSEATTDKVCTGTQPYTLKQGNSCIDQANRASCDQIVNNGENIAAYAPACGQCAPL